MTVINNRIMDFFHESKNGKSEGEKGRLLFCSDGVDCRVESVNIALNDCD